MDLIPPPALPSPVAGFDCYCLSFNYGQRSLAELKAARTDPQALGAAEHRVLDLALAQFGGSALTDNTIAMPVGGVQPGHSGDLRTST